MMIIRTVQNVPCGDSLVTFWQSTMQWGGGDLSVQCAMNRATAAWVTVMLIVDHESG